MSSKENKHTYIPLDEEVMSPMEDVTEKGDLSHSLSIAKEVNWLLTHKVPILGLEEIRKRYLNSLKKMNLVSPNGQVRQREFIESFEHFYGKEFWFA